MVYLSCPAENGLIYTKCELEAISEFCHTHGLYLFVDGARLGYGLQAEECDFTLADLARLCDVFYIGGTKVGALFGEAVVFKDEEMQRSFRYAIKQHGGMLAKGRLLGIQFATLFTDNLYMTIAQHAINEAMRIKDALQEVGISFLIDSPTNQQFPIFNNTQLEVLGKKYRFSIWQHMDEEHTAVRICTSWGTKKENVDQLIADIKQLKRD
jgi:threonine aldolase